MTLILSCLLLSAHAQPTDSLTIASGALLELEASLTAIDALEPSDADQETCIQRKRDALSLLYEAATRSEAQLTEALSDDHLHRASQLSRQLQIAQVKSRQLLAEAISCIPRDLNSDVQIEVISQGTAEEDETQPPAPSLIEPDPLSSSQFE